MIIKISGEEFTKPQFSDLIETIHLLLENDVTIFLLFGGGAQIDTYYQKFSGKSRKKKDGVGITTPEILEHGVIPAYNFLKDTLYQKFLDIPYSINILSPEDIETTKRPENIGLVGTPKHITLDQSKSLHIIGFVGANTKGQYYNINADEIALDITRQQKIDEVIFITGTGGILDTQGEIISEISEQNLVQMIAEKYEHAQISGGMQKKCIEILELLKYVPKVAMATSETLQHELFTHSGAGTICTRKTR